MAKKTAGGAKSKKAAKKVATKAKAVKSPKKVKSAKPAKAAKPKQASKPAPKAAKPVKANVVSAAKTAKPAPAAKAVPVVKAAPVANVVAAAQPAAAAKPPKIEVVAKIVKPEKIFKPLAKKQIAYFESRLLDERRRVLKELGHYDETFGNTPQGADGDLSAYSFHMADQGTDAMEREKAFLFASKEGRFLWHVDQALRRLYRNPEEFGKCHQCGGEIAFERLDALPHARYCIDCKTREEDGKK